jgi:peptide deformylase
MIKLLDYRNNRTALRNPGRKLTPEETKTPEFVANLEKMKEILALDGVGLAATQVGWPVQLFMLCIDENDNKTEPEVFINPSITSYSKKESKMEEGCLSFPGLFMPIKRPHSIIWEYSTLEGETITKESTDFYARAVQHEVDHCHGKVFIDKASTVQKMKIKKWAAKR